MHAFLYNIFRFLFPQVNHITYRQGLTLGETVVRVTSKVIAPAFAKDINWIGANDKVEFRKFIFILEAIRRECNTTSQYF